VDDRAELMRRLPAVGVLLAHPTVKAHATQVSAPELARAVRETVADERARRLDGQAPRDADALAEAAVAALTGWFRPHLKRVVNATGVVLNTNLGRAPLAQGILEGLTEVAGGYSNLELDLETGGRGSRYSHVEALIGHLTSAEAALVVNNCAAAVLLAVDTFARGREVVVSRGQLIEIGGSFRLPEVITASGAKLVEVGTTNKTYLRDYAKALSPETGLLMLSHTSNYRIVGFTAEVDRRDLAALGHTHGVVTMEDLGSGLLTDLTPYGLPDEPTVQQSVASGLDLVAVSGDKLMGGPQCGLLVGKREVITRLKANPLLRALRPDKLALAALEGTLKAYLQPATLAEQLPLFAALAKTPEALRRDAEGLAARLSAMPGLSVSVVAGESTVGGGTLPGAALPTWLVAVTHRAIGPDELSRRLRTGEPAVVGRISEGQLLLDPRTWLPGDAERLETAFTEALR
jgi:L-seryl-tRNA(Ser) seleniumtransferase